MRVRVTILMVSLDVSCQPAGSVSSGEANARIPRYSCSCRCSRDQPTIIPTPAISRESSHPIGLPGASLSVKIFAFRIGSAVMNRAAERNFCSLPEAIERS